MMRSKRSTEKGQKDGNDMVIIEVEDNKLRDPTIVLTYDLSGKPLTLINTIGTCRYCHNHTAGVDYRI